jgi:hypothetical protein
MTALWGQNHPATLFGSYGGNGLGLIPDWQFSPDPRVNSNLNPNVVTFPPNASPVPGSIGFPMRAGAQLIPAQAAQAAGAQLGLPIVDSWWWKNRKTLLIGTGVVVITAVAATLSAVLR